MFHDLIHEQYLLLNCSVSAFCSQYHCIPLLLICIKTEATPRIGATNLSSEWIVIHTKSQQKFLLNEFGFQTERGAPFSLKRNLRMPIGTSKHSTYSPTNLRNLQKILTYHIF